MRAGRLDRRITIQRKTDTASSSGERVPTWAALVHRRPASYRPLRGDERFAAPQTIANEQVEFGIRYSDIVSDLSPLDRVIYPPPADQDVQEPSVNTIYDIAAVAELGRREGLIITATRRADVTP